MTAVLERLRPGGDGPGGRGGTPPPIRSVRFRRWAVVGVVAALLIAVAQDDDAKAPADKSTFAQAAKAADVDAIITVYPGKHGWMVSDSPAYDTTAAARGEADLKALYAGALG